MRYKSGVILFMEFMYVSAMIITLSACSMAYHPKNIYGGYYERQIDADNNIWVVGYKSSYPKSIAVLSDFAFYRCAELTLLNDMIYFSYLYEPFGDPSRVSLTNYTICMYKCVDNRPILSHREGSFWHGPNKAQDVMNRLYSKYPGQLPKPPN